MYDFLSSLKKPDVTLDPNPESSLSRAFRAPDSIELEQSRRKRRSSCLRISAKLTTVISRD
jgi:hypothetical protein